MADITTFPIPVSEPDDLGAAPLPLEGTETLIVIIGGVAFQAPVSALGGLTNFDELRTVTAPNATVPVSSFSPAGAEADIDIALVPKGVGAFTLQIPDNTAAGGEKRGLRAIDLQLSRSSADQVAHATASVAIGYSNRSAGVAIGGNNTVNAASGVAIGNNNTVSSGTAIGSNNSSTGGFSFASGGYASDLGLAGVNAFSSSHFGAFTAIGNSQRREVMLRKETTSATPTFATVDNGANSATNCLVLQNNSSLRITIDMVARQNTTGDSKEFTLTCLATRGADASTTAIIGAPVATSAFASAGAATWAMAVSVNTTLGAVVVQVTGEAAKTIRWVAQAVAVEVAFN